jgi:hypothetical protein
MDCLSLLRISARLLDLHDAERAVGNSPAFSTEERRGLRDGRYLDIAGTVLDALRANAHGSGNAFVGFDALLIGLREEIPDLDADDLRYVLNVLSRPTELWAIDRQADGVKLVSDKASALVERTFFAEDYRLAPAGRAAIAVAANIQSFAYAEGDVLKSSRRGLSTGNPRSTRINCLATCKLSSKARSCCGRRMRGLRLGALPRTRRWTIPSKWISMILSNTCFGSTRLLKHLGGTCRS